jgi:hypothetical protein
MSVQECPTCRASLEGLAPGKTRCPVCGLEIQIARNGTLWRTEDPGRAFDPGRFLKMLAIAVGVLLGVLALLACLPVAHDGSEYPVTEMAGVFFCGLGGLVLLFVRVDARYPLPRVLAALMPDYTLLHRRAYRVAGAAFLISVGLVLLVCVVAGVA